MSNGLHFISLVGLWLWISVFSLTILGTYLARKRLRSSPPHLDAPFNLFPVSIIKPLKGVDDELLLNLEGFFRLDYPDYELIFCLAHHQDPAMGVVTQLIARFPEVKTQVLVGETRVGPNPKVNNLLKGYAAASHDWLLISDSNVRVSRNYLKRLVAHLDPGVGIVTAVVAGHEARGLGGALEAVYLNSFYTRGMNLAAALGQPCVVGKTMLFRRSVAERFGGLKTLGCYLAEDFMVGEAMRRLGLEVVIATDPAEQVIGDYSASTFWKRHMRWGRIRKQHAMGAFILEPWTGALVSGLVGAYAAGAVLGVAPSHFLALHLITWAFFDATLMHAMRVRLHWSTPFAWFLREIIALPLWLHIAVGNTVEWRGHRLAIGSGGILSQL